MCVPVFHSHPTPSPSLFFSSVPGTEHWAQLIQASVLPPGHMFITFLLILLRHCLLSCTGGLEHTPPYQVLLFILRQNVTTLFRVVLTLWALCFILPSSWDYRLETTWPSLLGCYIWNTFWLRKTVEEDKDAGRLMWNIEMTLQVYHFTFASERKKILVIM